MSYSPNSTRYETMPYRRCGKSGLLLPALSLGLWQNFGHKTDAAVARAMILTAFDQGITHFDLANNYGPPPGSAEENFGRILHDDLAAHRDELIISSKAGYRMWSGPYGEWGSRKYLLASLDQSLRRMRLDYVDIFYSHRPDPDTPLEETMDALAQAVRSGKAYYVGLSNYRPKEARRAIEILRSLNVRCLLHQPRYNILDRWVEDGLLEILESEGIGCIPFCPLAQGLLTSRYLDSVPADSRAARPGTLLSSDNVSEYLPKIRALNTIAASRGQTLAQMALAWLLRRPAVTSVLIGASRPEQILENLAVLRNYRFSPDELKEIDAACESTTLASSS